MKTTLLSIFALTLSASICLADSQKRQAHSSQAADKKQPKAKTYDGNWWLASDSAKRIGFLDGVSDCLLSRVHEKWPTNSHPELDEQRITLYYKSNPVNTKMHIVDVWRETLSKSAPLKPTLGGEVYTNPHGYYDGEFWREGSDSANRGFLEGYIWCMHTSVKGPAESYSRSIDYYFEKIWDYLQAHPKTAYNEAIADILAHFRDHAKPK